jgi:predicted MFS family arabinose efflux permease
MSLIRRGLSPWRGLGALPGAVWVIFWTSLVNRAGTMVLPFLVLWLTRERGYGEAAAGMFIALYGAAALVTAPFAGRWADRIGPAVVMKLSLLSSAVVLALFPFARSGVAIGAATVAFAVCSECFRPASMTIVTAATRPEDRRTAFALVRLAINLGMSIGPAVGGFLAERSFASIFLVDAATSAAAFLLLVLTKLPAHPAEHAGIVRPAFPLAALADARLRAFLYALVPIVAVFFQHEAAMPLFLTKDLGLSASTYGLLFTLNTAIIVFLEVPISVALSSRSLRSSMVAGSLLFAVGFGALAVVRTTFGVAVTVVIWTFGEMILLPALSAWVAGISPRGREGEYMGLYTMTFSLGFALGPWAGTAIYGRYGGTVLWLATLACGLVATALFARVPEDRAQAAAG